MTGRAADRGGEPDEVLVALADPTRRRLLDALAGLAAEWDARLAAIKRLAEADQPPG